MLLCAALLTSCGKKELSLEQTSEELGRSFQTSKPEVKDSIMQAQSAIQSSNYLAAVTILSQTVTPTTITEPQKKAVDAVILQTRSATTRNPSLDSAELHKALADLLAKAHGEN